MELGEVTAEVAVPRGASIAVNGRGQLGDSRGKRNNRRSASGFGERYGHCVGKAATDFFYEFDCWSYLQKLSLVDS